ncbi:DUF397 domain-containing protein [Streptomyces thermospinosisporus]|uniref:DUF397 domain-containing protein n=1 Tax=Streptomyces thermospinosisporus TaxID=161482 RepID=A0ABN1YHF8_9ACTN
MGTPDIWRKSSYSGPGDGDSCVEVARRRAGIAIRDSKVPHGATLTFPTAAFATFVAGLKESTHLTNAA